MPKLKQRNGGPAEIVRLDFHDFHGRLIDRVRAKVTEKDKGIVMIERIEGSFGITNQDKRDYHKKVLASFQASPIQWTRDEKGNIKSPFTSKKKWL